MDEQNQDPANTGEDQGQSRDKRAKAHFKEHVAAIRNATTQIGVLNNKLKEAQPNDKDDIHRELDTQVAQLHLAVNNAHDAPEDDEIEENTGGAMDTSAVDPNAGRKSRRKAS